MWVIFALLDPNSDPADQNQCEFGSETLVTPIQDSIVEMGIN
jgi:hypothetical protein